MKLLIILALVAIAVARPDGDHYDSKYDNFDIAEITANERLLKAYAHCFIGDGKCTPEGNEFKKLLPEATQTNCAKCTEKQKVIIAEAIKAIQNKLPTEYEALIQQSDPDGQNRDLLQKFIDTYAS